MTTTPNTTRLSPISWWDQKTIRINNRDFPQISGVALFYLFLFYFIFRFSPSFAGWGPRQRRRSRGHPRSRRRCVPPAANCHHMGHLYVPQNLHRTLQLTLKPKSGNASIWKKHLNLNPRPNPSLPNQTSKTHSILVLPTPLGIVLLQNWLEECAPYNPVTLFILNYLLWIVAKAGFNAAHCSVPTYIPTSSYFWSIYPCMYNSFST